MQIETETRRLLIDLIKFLTTPLTQFTIQHVVITEINFIGNLNFIYSFSLLMTLEHDSVISIKLLSNGCVNCTY